MSTDFFDFDGDGHVSLEEDVMGTMLMSGAYCKKNEDALYSYGAHDDEFPDADTEFAEFDDD